jgi:hypothetical protein
VNVQELRDQLRERADGLDGTRPDRLDELFDRIRTRRRRRAGAAVAAVTAVVVAVVGGAALVRGGDQAAPPVRPPHPTHDIRTTPAPERPVVYLESGTFDLRTGWRRASLHYGDRVIDPGVRFAWTDSTDEGLVLGGEDGRIHFWSAADSTLRQIGTLGFRPHSYRASGLVRSDTAGSLVAWFDSTDPSTPELVVYDTQRQAVVVRHPESRCQELCTVEALVGEHVYWSDHVLGYGAVELDHLRQFDLATGADASSGRATYSADLRARPRALVLTSRSGSGEEIVAPGPELRFVVHGGRLSLASDGNRPPLIGTPEVLYTSAQDTATGTEVAPAVPTLYADGTVFQFVQWLDDDRFAVMGGGIPDARRGRSHLLGCSVTDQTCALLAGGRSERVAVGLPLNF